MTKPTKPRPGVLLAGYVDTPVHRAVKAAAKQNGRTLAREVNHRLRQSIEAERNAKRIATEAAQ
jgi:hypothetical protein